MALLATVCGPFGQQAEGWPSVHIRRTLRPSQPCTAHASIWGLPCTRNTFAVSALFLVSNFAHRVSMVFPGDPAPPPDSASARTYQRLEARTRGRRAGLARSAPFNADAHIGRHEIRPVPSRSLLGLERPELILPKDQMVNA